MFSTTSGASDLEFPRPKSVSLHKHMTYEEYRQLQYEKFKRAGALGVLGKDRYLIMLTNVLFCVFRWRTMVSYCKMQLHFQRSNSRKFEFLGLGYL